MNRVPVHNNGITLKGLKLADSREEMTDKDAGTPRVYLVRHGECINRASPSLAALPQN